MASVSTYLNFSRNTEEAFLFYQTVFGGEFIGGISRYESMPPFGDMPPMSEEDKNLVMHVVLTITGGHKLMGSDAPESMGFTVIKGNNVNLNIEPESKAEADRLFHALSAGGKVTMPLQDTFWGAYFGSLTDKFGINWMINFSTKPQ